MKKPNLFNKQLFLDQRQLHQSMLRDKKTKFYLTTTPKDVKNSKLFWEFYQNEMKIKSDKSNYNTPNSILFNNKILSNDDDITDAFNKHFSSLVSENNVNDSDCNGFIFKNFQNIYASNQLKLPKLLSKRMKEYFEFNNLFFVGQHGFRSNHSCETAIHELVSSCLANIDKRLVNLLLFY